MMTNRLLPCLAAIAACAIAPVARADVVFLQIQNNQAFTDENIITHSNLITQGALVQGATNRTNVVFDFASTTDLLSISGSNGFATIEANDGFINQMSIAIKPGQAYNAFDPIGLSLQNKGKTTGTVVFWAEAYSAAGVLEPIFTSAPFTLGLTGETKFLIDAINGEVLTRIGFTAVDTTVGGVGVNVEKQTSVTLTNIPVPEPASLALLGLGLAGLGVAARRGRASGATHRL